MMTNWGTNEWVSIFDYQFYSSLNAVICWYKLKYLYVCKCCLHCVNTKLISVHQHSLNAELFAYLSWICNANIIMSQLCSKIICCRQNVHLFTSSAHLFDNSRLIRMKRETWICWWPDFSRRITRKSDIWLKIGLLETNFGDSQ